MFTTTIIIFPQSLYTYWFIVSYYDIILYHMMKRIIIVLETWLHMMVSAAGQTYLSYQSLATNLDDYFPSNTAREV